MNTRDLFENASLDVLGLLDDDERQEFERAFRAADPALQAQIRREQLRVSSIDDWLPAVDAPAGLKSRVVGAVRDAIVSVHDDDARTRTAQRAGIFSIALQRNVSPLWRAACIGLATATIVLGGAVLRVQEQYQTVASTVASDQRLADVASMFGPRFADSLLDDATAKISFVASNGSSARATIIAADNADNAYLLTRDLPSVDGGYRLVRLADNGAIDSVVTNFDSRGGRDIFEIGQQLVSSAAYAILPVAAGDDLSRAVLISVA